MALSSAFSGLDRPVSVRPAEETAYADVIVPRHLDRAFTYVVPSELRPRVRVGSVVLVPFGASKLRGLVVALAAAPPAPWKTGRGNGRLREIVSLCDGPPDGALDPGLLELTRLVSERYLAPWGQCLRLVEPRRPRRSLRLLLTEAGRAQTQRRTLSPVAKAILTRLASAPRGLTASRLKQLIKRSLSSATDARRVLMTLKRRGWIREEDRHEEPKSVGLAPERTPGRAPATVSSAVPLPESPIAAHVALVAAAISEGRQAAFLLEARSSVRLECLLYAVKSALASGRGALVLVPEIIRASTMAERMRSRWGDRVALVHSGLSAASRAAAWDRIRSGSVDVVVGTRSAIFAPLRPIGLIAVDDEDDPALKEQEEPRYHGRDVAWMRTRQENAVLLLGSAHPSLETRASPQVVRLPVPAESGTLPVIHVVDLRRVPPGTLFSPALLEGLEAAIETRAGVVLFQNRKGFAPALLCQDCGTAPHCPRCSVALTFYKKARRMGCRYCGRFAPVPERCQACQGTALAPIGCGTERIEEELHRLFPMARIGRLDRDTALTSGQAEAIRRQTAEGKFDILIGTQMLFQGSPLPPVGLVGVPHADAGLHLPDFRSAERCYQVLADAVALARSAERGGRVLLQTHFPGHHAIVAISRGEPAIFYDREVGLRKALGYPPFTSLISLSVSGRDPGCVKSAAQEWARLLRQHRGDASASLSGIDGDAVLGPIPSVVPRLRGRHRWQLLVKSRDAEAARRAVKATLRELEGRNRSKDVKLEVDVDPVEML